MSKATCLRLTFIVFMIPFVTVKGRWLELEHGSTTSMISDGIHDINPGNSHDYLHMGASNYSLSTTMLYGEKRCHSIYGFLPCADTMLEGVFLMILYTHLMMLGEEWIHKGSQTLFLLLGDVAFGSSVFRVLMALPRIVLVIVGGVGSTKSDAQYQVAFGVSIYAGSTLITLTFIWGLCIILNKGQLHKKELTQGDKHQQDSSKDLPHKHILSILNDDGVKIDEKTGDMALIMLLSLVPFTTIGLVALIKNPTMILLSLVVSFLSLAIYFGYQIWNPWVQARSLAYLKEEKLQIRFFYHIQEIANEKLVDEHGKTNIEALDCVFDRADNDNDGRIIHEELEKLIKNFDLEKDDISNDYAETEILNQFDDDGSKRINREEFKKGCTKWLAKWKKDNSSFDNSHYKNLWQQVHEIEILNEREMEKIMSRILKHWIEKHELVNENREADEQKIQELFSQYFKNSDNRIRQDELQKFIASVDFGVSLDQKTIIKKIERDFQQNGNHNTIGKDEFVNWFSNWTERAIKHDPNIKDPKQAIAKFDEVDETKIQNRREIEKIMSRILKHLIDQKHELVNENKEADKQLIKELFSQYFKNSENVIHQCELQNFIASVDFGVSMDHKTIFKKIERDFYRNGNYNTIWKDEFVIWFGNWIDKAIKHDPTIEDPKQAITKFDEDSWVKNDKKNMVIPIESIVYLVSGIAVMLMISSAFMQSIQQFSNAANIPLHLTSFIVIPIVMNARMAITSFFHAGPRVSKNASLTFSEIYNGLVMNNLLGLFTLLAIVYLKGLSWTYSKEVLTIMLPCAVVGLFALTRKTYPLWASILAILLYPIYGYLYCVMGS